jgi:hypothetical protein
MAALTLPLAAKAQVTISNLSNITVAKNGLLDVDIDGDGTFDFFINNAHETPTFGPETDGALIFSNGGSNVDVAAFNLGDPISTGADGNTDLGFGAISGGTGYIGVNFVVGGTTHTGWLLFDLTASNGDVVLESAGWQATADADINAGDPAAVPEPANVATGLGLVAGLAAWLRRRRSVG